MYHFDISVRDMELSATAKVILGMLAARPRSGYEIKQLVDNSARYFWTASYGQIYPELKRLEKDGLIKGTDSAQGNRQRTKYTLTAKGRRAAKEWIGGAEIALESRDEGLLKLFFAGSIDPPRTAEIARERAAVSRAKAAELHLIKDAIDLTGEPEGPDADPDDGSLLVLNFGIEASEFAAQWFEHAADELERKNDRAATAAGGR
jgi:DNA-binding PadR family transcriptional regulator